MDRDDKTSYTIVFPTKCTQYNSDDSIWVLRYEKSSLSVLHTRDNFFSNSKFLM